MHGIMGNNGGEERRRAVRPHVGDISASLKYYAIVACFSCTTYGLISLQSCTLNKGRSISLYLPGCAEEGTSRTFSANPLRFRDFEGKLQLAGMPRRGVDCLMLQIITMDLSGKQFIYRVLYKEERDQCDQGHNKGLQ